MKNFDLRSLHVTTSYHPKLAVLLYYTYYAPSTRVEVEVEVGVTTAG